MRKNNSLFGLMAAGFVGAVVALLASALKTGPQSYAQGGGDKDLGLIKKVSWLSRTSPPVGTVVAFAGEWRPKKGEGGTWTEEELGWMLCDGRALDAEKYKNLFATIGTSWGNGTKGTGANPKTKFNLPDLRGMFLRGTDSSAKIDPDAPMRVATMPGGNAGDRVGSVQSHQLASHSHTVNDPGHHHAMGNFSQSGQDYGGGKARSAWAHYGAKNKDTENAHTGITIGSTGGKETRPINAGVHWIIKFK